MAYTALVEFVLQLDRFTVFDAKHASKYMLRFSISHRKESKSIVDKIKPKTYFAHAYQTLGDTSVARTNGIHYQTFPLQMVHEMHEDQLVCRLNSIGYFRLEVPCYPTIWNRVVDLTIELLAKPDIPVLLGDRRCRRSPSGSTSSKMATSEYLRRLSSCRTH